MATEITNDTPKYLTWREVLQALLDGKTVQAAARQIPHTEKYWYEINPENNFSILHKSNVVYRIKPKPKVKKWRWVVLHSTDGRLAVSATYYASKEEYNEKRGYWTAIQKIDSTMIEVEE
ncbi:MAG TPA: hypothetical protein VFM18_15825 [Methanosarcina sp.]|nr:hypothetical protein [Methanosarcina sp.]